MKNPFYLVSILTIGATLARGAEPMSLFDGKSLDGWEVRSGTATYKVVDGAIVGTTAEGSLNTFLCTKREFGDFVLEFEVKCDPALNSGVQIRSAAYATATEVVVNGAKIKHEAGRVYGYQVEIAANGDAGRVYDEARTTRWLDLGKIPRDQTPEEIEKATATARKVYKSDGWNQYRVIAQGDRIQTFINGAKIVDFHDRTTARGFIGLQVHRVKPGTGPYSVSWRNLRLRELRPGEQP